MYVIVIITIGRYCGLEKKGWTFNVEIMIIVQKNLICLLLSVTC